MAFPRLRSVHGVALVVASLLAGGASLASASIPPPTISSHSATFAGAYRPVTPHTNYTSTCNDAGIGSAATGCRLWFSTPLNYKSACTSTANATYVTWAPSNSDPSKTFTLLVKWSGGGAMDGTSLNLTTFKVYTVHIQIADLCGNKAADADTMLNGFDAGSWNLSGVASPSYKFTGYVDVI